MHLTAKIEEWLNSFFGDDRRRSVGSGWISGTLSIVLGILALCSVLAVRFPQWLTVPELRDRYPLELVRWAIDLGILASLLLAGLSMILRRKKTLGITGLLFAAGALALGAGNVPLGSSLGDSIYLGLDWFVLGVLSTATLFVPMERAFPLKHEQSAFRIGWLTDAQYFFMSHALVQMMSVLVLLPVVNLGGMLAVTKVQQFVVILPLPVQFIACLVIADFVQYWVHRAFHRVPLLWRFHRVHHSVRAMDWLAGSRLHLVDVIITRGLVLLPLVLLGFDELAIFAYLGFVSFHAVFIHANFAPRLSWLERWIVMPRFHHWHHARESKAIDKNFAVHLPWIDRIFGTKYLPHDKWPSSYGIVGERAPDGYLNQLVWPFNR